MSTVVVSHTARPRHARHWMDALVLIVMLIALWQGMSEVLGPDVLTTPIATVKRAIRIVSGPDFPQSLYVTLLVFAFAFVISAVADVYLGLLLGTRGWRAMSWNRS